MIRSVSLRPLSVLRCKSQYINTGHGLWVVRTFQCSLLQYGVCGLVVGHGGALVESIAFNRRVVGSTPALAAM